MYNLSNTIRKIMIDRHITVTELSKKMDLKQQALSRKLQNENEDYKTEYLYQVLSSLNCDLEIVIKDSETKDILYTLHQESENIDK